MTAFQLLVADEADGPLTDRTKRNAQRVGHYLSLRGMAPQRVRCATRGAARQMADKCIKAAGGTTDRVEADASLNDPARGSSHDEPSLIVAPGATVLAILAHRGVSVSADALEAGALVIAGDGTAEIVAPSSLPRTFTVDGPDGPEQRDRPPYYYSQSGALPFRWRKGRVEILLISKRRKDRWGIPKGIIEPGLTAAASAAKETVEEAGAIGRVDSFVLGHYQIEKWGGICDVAVFPLEVTDVLEASQWAEAHKRDRHWFHAADAQDVMKVPELVPMIDGLLARYMKVLE